MIKKSMRINGLRTSLALEAVFWDGLEQLVDERKTTPPKLVAQIGETRTDPTMSLAAAVRVYLYSHARGRSQSR
jgi:predicted DNA-binding ribbon-helix-helix protein